MGEKIQCRLEKDRFVVRDDKGKENEVCHCGHGSKYANPAAVITVVNKAITLVDLSQAGTLRVVLREPGDDFAEDVLALLPGGGEVRRAGIGHHARRLAGRDASTAQDSRSALLLLRSACQVFGFGHRS